MKPFVKRLLMCAAIALACGVPAFAQTYVIPQATSGATTVFSAVTIPQTSGCLGNQGQNMYFLRYTGTGGTGNPTGVQIHLEGSFNSDSASCTSGTWFPISDDGTDPGPLGTNFVLAIGSYPFIRANLVSCATCNAGNSLTASFFGTSSAPGNPFGSYGAGQQIRKVVFPDAPIGTVTSSRFITPYGSTAGFLVINGSNTFTAGTLTARCQDFGTVNITSFTVPSTTLFILPVAPTTCIGVDVQCNACANSSGAIFGWWIFYPPGSAQPATAQPANTKDSEATGVNTTVTTTLTVAATQRGHLFSVSARCSAGTAGITVADGATTIWSTAAAEVGTTTFKNPWNPALVSSPGNNLVISLTTCGAANTGTLDVQGSVF